MIVKIADGKTVIDASRIVAITTAESGVSIFMHIHLRGHLGAITAHYGESKKAEMKADFTALMAAWEACQSPLSITPAAELEDGELFT